ncbi:MAG TPA: DUF2231 domain-containing protein [Armatimonadota bacterium]|nr:DUF2231 domain-containing protein [Armatimonadota bacterium]
MRSNARIGDHPIHPMLITIPIGLWVGSLVFDIVYLSSGIRFWYAAAYWNMLAGVIGALVAAVFGLWDYLTLPLDRHARAVATAHMILNVGAVILFILNLWARANYAAAGPGSSTWVFIFSLVIIGGVAISGWLGAHLAHVEKVSVVTEPRLAHEDAVIRGLAGTLGGEARTDESSEDEEGRRH